MLGSLGWVTSDYISHGLGWVGLQEMDGMDPRPCLRTAYSVLWRKPFVVAVSRLLMIIAEDERELTQRNCIQRRTR